jgi:hypothetical protein
MFGSNLSTTSSDLLPLGARAREKKALCDELLSTFGSHFAFFTASTKDFPITLLLFLSREKFWRS